MSETENALDRLTNEELEGRASTLRTEIAGKQGEAMVPEEATLRAIERLLADRYYDALNGACAGTQGAPVRPLVIDRGDARVAGQYLRNLDIADATKYEKAELFCTSAQCARWLLNDPDGRITFEGALAATQKIFQEKAQTGSSAGIIHGTVAIMETVDQWLNASDHWSQLVTCYRDVYENRESAAQSAAEFRTLLSDLSSTLQERFFNNREMSWYTENSKMDAVLIATQKLIEIAREMRTQSEMQEMNLNLHDPLVETVLYQVLRDVDITKFHDVMENMHVLLKKETQGRKTPFHPITSVKSTEPSLIEQDCERVMKAVFDYLEIFLMPALQEQRQLQSMAARLEQEQIFLLDPTSSVELTRSVDEICGSNLQMYYIAVGGSQPTLSLMVDGESHRISLSQFCDGREQELHLYEDGRIIHADAPDYVTSCPEVSVQESLESIRRLVPPLHASLEERIRTVFPALLARPELLQTAPIVRYNDQLLLLMPDAFSRLMQIPRIMQEASPEFLNGLMGELSVLGFESYAGDELGNWRAWILPSSAELEQRYFTTRVIDGNLAQEHGAGGNGEGGAEVDPPTGTDRLPRLRIIRNTLLAHGELIGHAEFATGSGQRPSFSEVETGHYTIVTIESLRVQFVVSDDHSRAAYVLNQPITLEDFPAEGITVSWLQRHSARAIRYHDPRQFALVIEQALTESEMYLSPQGYSSITDLVRSERESLSRLLARVARFGEEHPMERERNRGPLELIPHDFRRIKSGECGLYCGDTVLAHLQTKGGKGLSVVDTLKGIQELLTSE